MGGGGSSPNSGLTLIADNSLCDLRDQDKEVKKLFPRKKISSFTSATLDVAEKPHWSCRKAPLEPQKLLMKPGVASCYEGFQNKAGKHGIKSTKRIVGWYRQGECILCRRKCSECTLVTDEKISATNVLGHSLGWWWQCHYSTASPILVPVPGLKLFKLLLSDR